MNEPTSACCGKEIVEHWHEGVMSHTSCMECSKRFPIQPPASKGEGQAAHTCYCHNFAWECHKCFQGAHGMSEINQVKDHHPECSLVTDGANWRERLWDKYRNRGDERFGTVKSENTIIENLLDDFQSIMKAAIDEAVEDERDKLMPYIHESTS